MEFHEYWDNENKLLELSYKESIRQRDERKRRNTMAIVVMAIESPNELDDKQRAEQQHVD